MFAHEIWPKSEVKLPAGKRVALMMSVAFEGEEDHWTLGDGHIDYLDFYERQYGPRRGVWRILDVLAKNQVASSWVIPGAIIENYPEACRAAAEDGHEIAAHSYHHEHFELMTAEEEKRAFESMMRAFHEFGVEPLGFRTCFPSTRTIDNVLDYGFRYDTTHRDEELPYKLQWDDGRTMLEIPRNVNGDAHLFGTPVPVHNISTGKYANPKHVADHWKREFLAAYEAGASETRLMGLTLHPFASGHPGRARAVDEFLAFTRTFSDVWYATHAEIADLWLQAEWGEGTTRTNTAYTDESQHQI